MSMKLHSHILNLGIGLAILLLPSGCVFDSGYGRITAPGQEVTIQDLARDWQAFEVTYCGVRPERPLGLMFDPKDDAYSLTGKSWKPIQDAGSLEKTLMWLEATDHQPPAPRLWQLVGPEGAVYGYLYTGTEQVVMRSIDENTLYVMEITERHNKIPEPNVGSF